MYLTEQAIDMIFLNCEAIIDCLDSINQTNQPSEIAYHSHIAGEAINTIKSSVEYLSNVVREKDSRILLLHNNVEQLELQFDDLEAEIEDQL